MKSRLATFALAVTAFAVPTQATAQSCLTAAEAQGLLQFTMPDILDGIMKQCQTHAPATGFMAKSGASMVTRYRSISEASWPTARRAFLKFTDEDNSSSMVSAMPDSVLKGLIGFGVTAAATNEIKSDDCGKIDRLWAALSPLPPENMASAFGIIIEMTSSRNSADQAKGKKQFSICPPANSSTASK